MLPRSTYILLLLGSLFTINTLGALRASSLSISVTDLTTSETLAPVTGSTPDANGDYNLNFAIDSALRLGPTEKTYRFSMNAASNPEGSSLTAPGPYLDSSFLELINNTGSTHHFTIVVTAQDFSLPLSNLVEIETRINSIDATGVDFSQPSSLTLNDAGSAFTRQGILGITKHLQMMTSTPVVQTGNYTLSETYDMYVLGNGPRCQTVFNHGHCFCS